MAGLNSLGKHRSSTSVSAKASGLASVLAMSWHGAHIVRWSSVSVKTSPGDVLPAFATQWMPPHCVAIERNEREQNRVCASPVFALPPARGASEAGHATQFELCAAPPLVVDSHGECGVLGIPHGRV